MTRVFISYRRDDAAGYAGRLHEALERKLGDGVVFRDVDTLQPGEDFVKAIDVRLSACSVVLVLIGREWLDASRPDGTRRLHEPYDFVRLEIASALAQPNVRVIPVLIEDAAMPSERDLPEPIRLLARRHAISLRDEAWDSDVDRLADVIEPSTSQNRRVVTASSSRVAPWLAAGAVGLAAVAWLVVGALRSGPVTEPASSDELPGAIDTSRRTDSIDARAPRDSPDRGEPDGGAFTPFTIRIPRVAEAAFQDLIYSVVSGNVVRAESSRELRLRIRLANFGDLAANFWDESFRLVVGDRTLAATSNLNTVMAPHSIGYGVVSFRVPMRAGAATLRIRAGDSAADIPLDVSATGRPPVDEDAPIADSQAQAVGKVVSDRPSTLIETDDLRVGLERAALRRFANTNRLTLSLRMRNKTPRDVSSGDFIVRAAIGDQIVSPWRAPTDVVAASSNSSDTAIFDLPPSASSVVLRARVGRTAIEHALDLR